MLNRARERKKQRTEDAGAVLWMLLFDDDRFIYQTESGEGTFADDSLVLCKNLNIENADGLA